MTPAGLLSLWRDRWGKPHRSDSYVRLASGKVSQWIAETAESSNWQVPGLSLCIAAIAIATLLLACTAALTTNSQIVLAWSIVGVTIYLRRHSGLVIGLTIAGMSLLLTMRYFYWRLDQTLPTYWGFSFPLGLLIILAEMHVWLRFAVHYIAKLLSIKTGLSEAQPRTFKLRSYVWRLGAMLRFYIAIPLVIFYATPLAALYFGAVPIEADAVSLGAYGIPHWLMARLAFATTVDQHRHRLVDWIREELAASAVLLRTTKSYIHTALKDILERGVEFNGRVAGETQRHPIHTPSKWGQWIGVTLFTGAVATYIHAIFKHQGIMHNLQPLYAILAIGFICAFIGAMAVQKEMDCVKLALSSKSKLRAMVKLPTGQLVSCMTSNFPDSHLKLSLPRAITLETNGNVEISLFCENYECPLMGKVLSLQGSELAITIIEESLEDYAEFKSLVFTRDLHWPLWLPARDADRLLPHWIVQLLMKGQDAFYNLTINSTMTGAIEKLKNWLKLGNASNV